MRKRTPCRISCVLVFLLLGYGPISVAAPQWADHAHDALQSYKRITDYWVDKIEPDTSYSFFAVPGVPQRIPPPDPNYPTGQLWQVAEQWNDDVELAQSLAGYWLLTGDQALADMFRNMADQIQLAPAIESEAEGPPWIQPGDTRIEQGYSTLRVDPEHSAEETTLIFPRLTYVDFGEPTAIELMTRTIWNFQDNVAGERDWGQAVNTGFLMRSPLFNARYVDWCWPGPELNDPQQYGCNNPPTNYFPDQDTIGNFRTVAPGLSLLWYHGPDHYFWKTNGPDNFMWGHNNAWIDASIRTEGGKPADVPPSKVLVDSNGGGTWQGYGDWKVNANVENNAQNIDDGFFQGWSNNTGPFRHFYHALAGQLIGTLTTDPAGAAAASDIVGTGYSMRQTGTPVISTPGEEVYMAFERQFLQWRPEIGNPQAYTAADGNLISGNSGSINLSDGTLGLTKHAARRMLVSQLHLIDFANSGQASDLNKAIDRAQDGYALTRQILLNEEANWTTGLTGGASGLTDQVKFDGMDALLMAAIGGGGIYDGAYPSMLFSWNDTNAEVVSLLLSRDTGNTSLWAWNYGVSQEVGLRLWRIEEGIGELRIGPDVDENGTMDSVTQTISIPKIRKGMEVRFAIPAGALQLIEIEVTTPQPRNLAGLPDVAIGYKDVQEVGNQVTVTVHNIGTGSTGAFNARLFDTLGTQIGTTESVSLAGFTGMNPVTATLNWTTPPGRSAGTVVLDQEESLNEISTLNNQWVIQPGSPTTTTTTTATTTTTTTTTTGTTTTTTLPSTNPGQSYYILNPVEQIPVDIVSLVDNNTIQMTSSVSLNKNEAGGFQVTEITGTGPFSIGSDVDGADMPIPDSFLSTQFAVLHDQFFHEYYLYSPNATAQVSITIAGITDNITVPQGTLVEYDAGGANSVAGIVTSTEPILVLHKSGNDDVYPVAPPATAVWGVFSQYVLIGALQGTPGDTTNFTVVADNGDSWAWDLEAGETELVPPSIGNNQNQGQGSALYISADKPIAVIQSDDGDVTEATSFWPASELGTHYGIPVDTQYIAVVCPSANTVVTVTDGGTPTNQNCFANGTAPGKAYFGSATSGTHINAGAIVESTNPVYLIYEASATEDEHNLKGEGTTSSQRYFILNPVEQISADVVSLMDNNTIQMSSSMILNENETSGFQVTKITGTRPFSIGSDVDGSDMPVPESFLSTQFVVPHDFGNHEYYLYSPDVTAQVTITVRDVTNNISVPKGQVIIYDAGGDNGRSGVVTSTAPILLLHKSDNNDVYPVAPPATALWGIFSGYVLVGALEGTSGDTTNFTVTSDNGLTWSWDREAGEQSYIPADINSGQAQNQAQGEGRALYISSNKPIAVIQSDDGDETEATAFWPASELGTHYGIPVDTQYIAVVCPSAGTVVTLTDGGSPTNQNCFANGTEPGKAYFGSATNGTHISAGAIVESTDPIYLIYEASATEDEHNLKGQDTTDSDGDGLTNTFELFIGTKPNSNDSDGDGLTDDVEVCYDGDCSTYDPYNPSTGTGGDLNANATDTDGDGFNDDVEDAAGTDPLDPLSFPSTSILGDINDDGQVNVVDILLAQKHLTGVATFNPGQVARGDLYPAGGDGQFTLQDYVLLQQAVQSPP